jgi:NTP pyrophosphatase (non-canonical NTP hydrolase)
MGYGDNNTFSGLRFVNSKRCEESFHRIDSWTPTDWMTAIAGEVGEAANLVKKLRRIESDGLDVPQNREMIEWVYGDAGASAASTVAPNELRAAVERELVKRLGAELADVVIYVDLLAARLGIDLGQAVIDKFNATSKKVGSSWTLPY